MEDGSGAEADPTWTLRESIVFRKYDANGNVAIYRLEFKTKKVSQNPMEFSRPRVSHNNPQLGDDFAAWIRLTPDSAHLMPDRSVEEIYAPELRFD